MEITLKSSERTKAISIGNIISIEIKELSNAGINIEFANQQGNISSFEVKRKIYYFKDYSGFSNFKFINKHTSEVTFKYELVE